MFAQVQAALTEISNQFSDSRTQLCQLTIGAIDNGRVPLQGTVLDDETLTAVTDQLQAKFPALTFEDEAVTILRTNESRRLVVTTSITGLHNSPGFRSELGSELLNGTEVELLQEDDRWVFVRQSDGYLGWAYRPYLDDVPVPKPTHLVCEPVAFLRSAPHAAASLENRVLAGTAVAQLDQQNDWRQIKLTGGQTGWLAADHLRSLNSFPQTESAQREQLIADSYRFMGVPYVWAGTSAYGIDCSGYVQLLYRLCGITLLRDADMQFDAGRPVEAPFQAGDLLFFGSDAGHRRISHVGMSLGGWQMIHSSRSRNGVFVDDVQEVKHLRETFMGARSFLS